MNTITKDHFERLNNDVNGNPRYYIGWCDVPIHVARKNGGVKYRGKVYGAGWVFQSYNLERTCNNLNKDIFEENANN